MKWSVCFERLDPVKTKFTKYGWSTHAKRGQFRGIWWLCSVSHCPSPPLHKKNIVNVKKNPPQFSTWWHKSGSKTKKHQTSKLPAFFKIQKSPRLSTHQTFRRKMVVSFKWYPSCLTHPGSPLKGDIPDKYPLYKVSFGVDYLGGFPHHFP